MSWTFYAAELTTGDVVTELPLSNVSAQRRINEGGSFSADLVLRNLPRDRRRDLITATSEARFTVVAARDDQIMGEWIVWRSQMDALGDSPVQLQGSELPSYLSMRPSLGHVFSQVDQATIAATMVTDGFSSGVGSVAVTVDAPATGVLRDRTYIYADAPILQRLSELSQVLGGPEFWVETVWDWSAGHRAVKRIFHIEYPWAGADRQLVFDQAPPTWRDRAMRDKSGGSITAMTMTADGTRLGTEAVAVCAGKGDGRVIGFASSDFLLSQGWPALTQMHSWQTVSDQRTADAHASALLSLSQSSEVPPQVTVLADGDPALGEYGLGDRVRIRVEETTNLPGGIDTQVRIIGWTMAPPDSGPETVVLEVTSIDLDPTVEGDS